MPSTSPAFAAVDWGTSSFRLWLLSGAGEVLGTRRGNFGMSNLAPDAFEGVLEENLAALDTPLDLPVVICGMAGAAQGWKPAPYLTVPTRTDEILGNAITVPHARRDIRILPGLAQRAAGKEDVIRGEETILLGASLDAAMSGLVCMPGTHSKWVRVDGKTILSFATAMTGEIFDLLAHKSTLKHFIDPAQNNGQDLPEFEHAVKQALGDPSLFLSSLFSVRAASLLAGADTAVNGAARLSGLLVGLEIAGFKHEVGEGLILVSSGPLSQVYARAFDIAEVPYKTVDAEEMARRGLFAAGRALWVKTQAPVA